MSTQIPSPVRALQLSGVFFAHAAIDSVRAINIGTRDCFACGTISDHVAGKSEAGFAREIEASRAALATAGVACEITGENLAIPAANGAVLAMALREAVTNVIRHAAATHCHIVLEQDADGVRLTVSDDGQGGRFAEGSGLRGMRARLLAAGGRLRVQAGKGGTEVMAAVPAVAAT